MREARSFAVWPFLSAGALARAPSAAFRWLLPWRKGAGAFGFVSAGMTKRGERVRAMAAVQPACAPSGGSWQDGEQFLIYCINLLIRTACLDAGQGMLWRSRVGNWVPQDRGRRCTGQTCLTPQSGDYKHCRNLPLPINVEPGASGIAHEHARA